MSDISAEKYVRLTTFTKDGRRKEAPVWIAALGDGHVGFTTGIETWKVKRIRHTPSVELAASDARGNVKPGATCVTGNARVVTDAEFRPVLSAIKAKYGFQFTLARLGGQLSNLIGRGPGVECGIVIALD